jgi:hypothetical protein
VNFRKKYQQAFLGYVMKIINMVQLMLAFIFTLAICFQQIIYPRDNVFYKTIVPVETKLSNLTADIASAKETMDSARDQLFESKTLQEDSNNIRTIIEQNLIITLAEHESKKLNEMLVKALSTGEGKQGYFSILQNVGLGILGRIKSVYSYTDDEKEIPHQIINGLERQKALITREFASKGGALIPALKNRLMMRYSAMMEQFDAEIHKQHIVTGQAMSFGKKVAWVTVTAAVAAALAFADKSEVIPELTQPIALKPTQLVTPKEEKKPITFEPTELVVASEKKQLIVPEEEKQSITSELIQSEEESKKFIQKRINELLVAIEETMNNSGVYRDFLQRAKLQKEKVINFIKNRLFESPTDSVALDYLGQLEDAHKSRRGAPGSVWRRIAAKI